MLQAACEVLSSETRVQCQHLHGKQELSRPHVRQAAPNQVCVSTGHGSIIANVLTERKLLKAELQAKPILLKQHR
jgi:hypothetical protein